MTTLVWGPKISNEIQCRCKNLNIDKNQKVHCFKSKSGKQTQLILKEKKLIKKLETKYFMLGKSTVGKIRAKHKKLFFQQKIGVFLKLFFHFILIQCVYSLDHFHNKETEKTNW